MYVYLHQQNFPNSETLYDMRWEKTVAATAASWAKQNGGRCVGIDAIPIDKLYHSFPSYSNGNADPSRIV